MDEEDVAFGCIVGAALVFIIAGLIFLAIWANNKSCTAGRADDEQGGSIW